MEYISRTTSSSISTSYFSRILRPVSMQCVYKCKPADSSWSTNEYHLICMLETSSAFVSTSPCFCIYSAVRMSPSLERYHQSLETATSCMHTSWSLISHSFHKPIQKMNMSWLVFVMFMRTSLKYSRRFNLIEQRVLHCTDGSDNIQIEVML